MHLQITRRLVLAGASSSVALFLAGCQSADLSLAEGDGASRAAADEVARARGRNGLSRLAPDGKLEAAAIEQAGYMAASGKMEHTALRGRDFETRIRARGIATPAAENLAHGRFDIAGVVDIWMNSPPHRRNMLDPRFESFGLGYAPGADGRNYWAMVLGA
ncbi:MAG: CAP domain-containing protein [Rhizobiaceae bacterium]|nr:CAP domain-containing protein [Rhizobiaceae bacterium]